MFSRSQSANTIGSTLNLVLACSVFAMFPPLFAEPLRLRGTPEKIGCCTYRIAWSGALAHSQKLGSIPWLPKSFWVRWLGEEFTCRHHVRHTDKLLWSKPQSFADIKHAQPCSVPRRLDKIYIIHTTPSPRVESSTNHFTHSYDSPRNQWFA